MYVLRIFKCTHNKRSTSAHEAEYELRIEEYELHIQEYELRMIAYGAPYV